LDRICLTRRSAIVGANDLISCDVSNGERGLSEVLAEGLFADGSLLWHGLSGSMAKGEEISGRERKADLLRRGVRAGAGLRGGVPGGVEAPIRGLVGKGVCSSTSLFASFTQLPCRLRRELCLLCFPLDVCLCFLAAAIFRCLILAEYHFPMKAAIPKTATKPKTPSRANGTVFSLPAGCDDAIEEPVLVGVGAPGNAVGDMF